MGILSPLMIQHPDSNSPPGSDIPLPAFPWESMCTECRLEFVLEEPRGARLNWSSWRVRWRTLFKGEPCQSTTKRTQRTFPFYMDIGRVNLFLLAQITHDCGR